MEKMDNYNINYNQFSLERKRLFLYLNYVLILFLLVYSYVYLFLIPHQILGTYFVLGSFIIVPTIVYLDKKDFHLISRYLFIIYCSLTNYIANIFYLNEVYSGIYFVPIAMVVFIIFELDEKKHIYTSLLFPFIFWSLKFIDYSFIPSRYILSVTPKDIVYLTEISFVFSMISIVLASNFFIKMMTKMKEIAILEEENKRAEIIEAHNQLEEARAMIIHNNHLSALGEMASGIAHEINNPLAIIASTSKALKIATKKENINRDQVEDCLKDIDSTVDRIYKIIKGLRTISRNEKSQELSKAFLGEILDDVFSLCSERFKNNEVELIVDSLEDLKIRSVICNRVKLSQVLLNLLNNSFDAVTHLNLEKKWVKVRFKSVGDDLLIKVIDAGNGIPEEIAKKIFDPFYTTKEIGKGTGLGLSISKRLMEEQNGKLYLDEKLPNTAFVIKIPQK